MPDYKVQKYKVRLVKDGATRVVPHERVHGSQAAVDVFRSVMRRLPHEEVWVAFLNARNVVTGLVRVGQGGMHACALKPADVLRPVLGSDACAFILAHNHPSGDPTPSQNDIEMTRALIKASGVVGLYFADHLIVTERGDWHSIRESHDSLDW